MYDSTVQALGFDEVRVRYRTQRRVVLREIILLRLHGDFLEQYIAAQAAEHVVEKDRKAFAEDVYEDLELMDENRIAGLGITLADLTAWKSRGRS